MKTILNVKTDKDLKRKAQEVAKEIGLPLSTVVTGFLKEFIEKKEVRFSVPYQMSPKLERRLTRTEKDIKAGRNMSGPFSSGEQMDKYLDSL